MIVWIISWSFYAPNITSAGFVLGTKKIMKCEFFKNEEKADRHIEKLNSAAALIGIDVLELVKTSKEL